METAFANHKYASTASVDTTRLKARAARVPKELGSLENSLSVSTSSSVFVRVSEANVYLWRALIIGPELTPYSGGCFIFDIYFPSQYPNVPPQVRCGDAPAAGSLCGACAWPGGGQVGVRATRDLTAASQLILLAVMPYRL